MKLTLMYSGHTFDLLALSPVIRMVNKGVHLYIPVHVRYNTEILI